MNTFKADLKIIVLNFFKSWALRTASSNGSHVKPSFLPCEPRLVAVEHGVGKGEISFFKQFYDYCNEQFE